MVLDVGLVSQDAFLYALAGLMSLIQLWLLNRPTSAPDSLNALLQVVTPCSSLWPRHYISLAKQRHFTLQVPLHLIIQDVISGTIELRAPQDTLERMISMNGELQIDPWRFFFSYRTLWPKILYKSCLRSIFPGNYRPLRLFPNPECVPTSHASQPHSSADVLFPESISVLPALLPTLAPHVLHKMAAATTLDTTPCAHLETALLALQALIPTGQFALLEFTSATAPVCSAAWLLSALPFFYPSSPSACVIQRCQRLASVPPLRNALPRVISLLESGTRSCVLLSIQNVSTQHARLLNDYACKLDGKAGREHFLAGFSDLHSESALCAWREEVFWARWEAACYTCGVLTRWVICMKRPTG